MCPKRYCACKATLVEIMDDFTQIFNDNYTTLEETYIDTEPDIARRLRELDQRAREAKRRNRGY